MAATYEEIAALRRAFEEGHSRPARALADLLLGGNVCPESHEVLEGPIGDAFEAFVIQCVQDQGVTISQFKAAVEALGVLKSTLDELDQLPE